MNEIISFKQDEDDKNFVDRVADFLELVKNNKAKGGLYMYFNDDGFQFDWYGDSMYIVGMINYANVVISNFMFEYNHNDE